MSWCFVQRGAAMRYSTKQLVACIARLQSRRGYHHKPTFLTSDALEKRCAEMFGKEASLFVPSGTMANLLAIMTHCDRRGSELIVGVQQHIHKYEQGGCAQLAGVAAYCLPNAPDGTIPLEEIRAAIRDNSDIHQPKTELICLENTHNVCGGRVLPIAYLQEVHALAKSHDAVVHIDGARILNAAVASRTDVADIVHHCDSVQMCFSKGLGAPVGSILAGSDDFIKRARRSRKALGGGLRQAGVLASAASTALDTADATLRLDHANARRLAQGLSDLSSPYVAVQLNLVETNIVVVETSLKAETICEMLARQSPAVLCHPLTENKLRLVTHLDIHEKDIDRVISCFRACLSDLEE